MYQIMFYVGLTLALIFLVISIVLFVRNHVAKLIGDVTGWNAKRAIKKIYEKEEDGKSQRDFSAKKQETVHKRGSTSARSASREKGEGKSIAVVPKVPKVEVAPNQSILEAIQESSDYSAANIFEVEEEMMVLATDSGVDNTETGDEATTLLVEQGVTNPLEGDETSVLVDEETTLLMGEEETTLLADEETTLLMGEEETTLLVDEETTLLMGEEETTLLTTAIT